MAQPIVLTTRHRLGAEALKRRIDERLEALKQNGTLAKLAALKMSWEGDVASFGAKVLGQNLTGSIAVREEDFTITVYLPALLMPMRGAIVALLKAQEGAIQEERGPEDGRGA